MRAQPGDRLVLPVCVDGEAPQTALVLEVHGTDGHPPFKIRWDDRPSVDSGSTLLYPSRDVRVESADAGLSPLSCLPGTEPCRAVGD